MRNLIIPGAAVALLAATSFAFAADATGTIKSINTTKAMMTLDNGSSYWAPASVKLSNFKVGEKVSVTYTMAKGKMEISSLKPSA